MTPRKKKLSELQKEEKICAATNATGKRGERKKYNVCISDYLAFPSSS